jgi:Zn-dependent peptidase ImmA (M78 family)
MKAYSFDSNGVPILSREDIEKRAEKFLRFFDKNCLEEPRLTPMSSIAKHIDDHGVQILIGVDLGKTVEGYRYRGRFHVPTKTIYIDKSLKNGGPRFNYTLAHEIGHFVLHRNLSLSALAVIENEEFSDTSRDLILDQIEENNPRTWLEWQANKFASSILLPRSTIPMAVIAKQQEMGINRNLGKIYRNRQSSSNEDYRNIMDSLKITFDTSIAAIRIRLTELNISEEEKTERDFDGGGPEHIRGAMLRAIQNIEASIDR